MSILDALLKAPKIDVLFIAGLFFLLLAVASRIKLGSVEILPGKSGLAVVIGVALLASSYVAGSLQSNPPGSPADLTPTITADQAIRDYYTLVAQSEYETAWGMLSDDFNRGLHVDTLDKFVSGWVDSGPAVISGPVEVQGNNNQATVTITLYYSKKGVSHSFRYELFRNVGCSNQRFGCWQIVRGEMLY